jgi:hypothetical protein
MPGKDAYALLVQVSADTTKLQKEMTKAKVEMTKTLEEIRKAAGVVEKAAELPGAKRAMESISGNARQLALQSGAARLGIFGDALESLGPLGLTAAAGVGALGAALAGAREAARFADELSDTANKLHVTTDALQEYRFALRLAGGEEKGADEALESFSVTLGKAQQGLQKSQRAFLAIGFTKEQIDGFKTSEEALRAVVERVAEIRNDPQRDAIISQLGLEKMKPLILAGVDALDEFRQQARDTGVVMDAALIARGAELNDQFETLNQVIGVQLKSALVDLGPIISGLLQTLATSIKYVSDLLSAFAAADRKRTDQLEADQRKLGGTVLRFQLKELGGQKLSGTERDYLGQTQRALAKVEAELAVRRISLPAAPSIPTGDLDIGGGRVSGGSSRRSGARASGRAAQPIRAVEVFDPEVVEILQALEYWQGVEKRSNELRPTLDVSGDFVATLDEQLQAARDATYQSLYDGVRSGLEAGFYGGVPGVIEYLKAQLMRALLDGVSRSLASALSEAAGSSGGGWVKAFASLLTGGFATGTNYAPGGMAMVGERGPELVNLPRGSTVTPHGIADIRPRASAGPVVIHADFTGAVVTEELMASFRSYADEVGARAAAEGAARGSAQAQTSIYTRARNRLGR